LGGEGKIPKLGGADQKEKRGPRKGGERKLGEGGQPLDEKMGGIMPIVTHGEGKINKGNGGK